MPSNCIKCTNIAVVLNKTVPYCVKCYKKEMKNVKRKSSKKNFRSM